MNSHVVIVAGGSGSRMKSAVPKQFIELNNKPILMHTIEVFHKALPQAQIVVVLPESEFSGWTQMCHKHQFSIKHHLAPGGQTRFHSVKNGIHALNHVLATDVIAIHDAARPFVSTATIQNTVQAAHEHLAAVPVQPIVESVRQIMGPTENKAVNRSEYVAIQTPQCFVAEVLYKAFEQEFNPLFTDDASVVELAGTPIHLVEGNRENIKITTPFDLILANAFLQANA